MVAEEARRKAKDEASRLADERVSLLLELGTCKNEMSSIRAEALKKKKCHTPLPGLTRLADPNRVRGARLYTVTLYLFFFSQS